MSCNLFSPDGVSLPGQTLSLHGCMQKTNDINHILWEGTSYARISSKSLYIHGQISIETKTHSLPKIIDGSNDSQVNLIYYPERVTLCNLGPVI